MSALKNILAGLAQGLVDILGNQTPRTSEKAGRSGAPRPRLKPKSGSAPDSTAPSDPAPSPGSVAPGSGGAEHGRERGAETIQVDPKRLPEVRIAYAPSRDGNPDAGEVIWTWVPYEENDGRGKDRPVLVIGRQSAERVYAVRMTSKEHRDHIAIGSGAWDSQGRSSWVDIEQLYSVHVAGTRREAAVLDRERYIVVAKALIQRYGWAVGE